MSDTNKILHRTPGAFLLFITAQRAGFAFAETNADEMEDAAELLASSIAAFSWPVHVLAGATLLALAYFIYRTIRNRNLATERFRETLETLLTITSAAKDAIVMMDHQGAVSFWNPAAESIFGYRSSEAMGRELHLLLAPQRYQDQYRAGFERFRRSGEGPTVGRTLELTAVRKDGTEFPLELSLSALQIKGKWQAVGILRDITLRKQAESELKNHREQLEGLVTERTEELNAVNDLLRKELQDRERTEEELYRSESFLSSIFDGFHDPFSIVDREFRFIRFNDVYAQTRGRMAKDLYGKKCYETLYNRTSICGDCIVNTTFQSKDPCVKEKLQKLADGSEAWFEISTHPIFDRQGNVSHVVEYSRDITARKREEKEKEELIRKLNHLSTTDSLTGLLNRRALNEMLEHEINRAVRYETDLSVILSDIDLFKQINDTHGHAAGDRALTTVADLLRRTVRRSDVAGRYGGDEFMIILPGTSIEGARELAEKVRLAVQDLKLDLPGNRHLRLSVSLGVAGCCSPGADLDRLVSNADAALYASKDAGRNRVSVLEPGQR